MVLWLQPKELEAVALNYGKSESGQRDSMERSIGPLAGPPQERLEVYLYSAKVVFAGGEPLFWRGVTTCKNDLIFAST